MADWSKLPFDIIHKVATFLISIEDFNAFSSVCSSWRSVYLAKQWHQPPQVPLLMFCTDDDSSSRKFVSLYRNKVYKSDMPELQGRQCLGSSLGWLVTIGNDLKIHLLNPFTRVCINLPPMSSLSIHFGGNLDWRKIVEKAYVFKKPCSSNANEDDLLVMIIYGPSNQLAFCRPGYRTWKSVGDDSNYGFVDVAFVKDQIIALCDFRYLVVIDIDGLAVNHINHPRSRERNALISLFPQLDWEKLFLVESSGDLWLVCQKHSGERRKSYIECTDFVVYSFDSSKTRWIRLSHLGDHAVFVNEDRCVCVRAPDRFKCKSNSIYFVGREIFRLRV